MDMKDIIVIAGPTGVGKTKISVMLAKKINAEIINADSMQIYKGMNIGTAKIKDKEKEGIKHHLFDIKDTSYDYSIYDYQKDCRKAIDDILSRGKKVILVGGSGLYIRAALYDYKFNSNEDVKDYSEFTNEELYKMALKIDKDCDIHINNRKRLERFLNKNSKIKVEEIKSPPLYDFDMIGLTTDRDRLYDIINCRVDSMMEEGLYNEVKSFYDKNDHSKAIMTAIGYKELYDFFDGKCMLDDSICKIKQNSRRFAKRQYTFFNNQFDMKWFSTDYDNIENTLNEILQYINR
jgi:tRNA dimethylallyltransferase